jgi:hypothetical protein
VAVYGYRNLLLLGFTYFPFPWNVAMIGGHAVKGLTRDARARRLAPAVRGIKLGLRVCWDLRRERCPLPHRTVWLDRRLRLAGALPLDVVEPSLPPLPVPREEVG